jgi:hypothetical protein
MQISASKSACKLVLLEFNIFNVVKDFMIMTVPQLSERSAHKSKGGLNCMHSLYP